jgi:hypothetical protein
MGFFVTGHRLRPGPREPTYKSNHKADRFANVRVLATWTHFESEFWPNRFKRLGIRPSEGENFSLEHAKPARDRCLRQVGRLLSILPILLPAFGSATQHQPAQSRQGTLAVVERARRKWSTALRATPWTKSINGEPPTALNEALGCDRRSSPRFRRRTRSQPVVSARVTEYRRHTSCIAATNSRPHSPCSLLFLPLQTVEFSSTDSSLRQILS